MDLRSALNKAIAEKQRSIPTAALTVEILLHLFEQLDDADAKIRLHAAKKLRSTLRNNIDILLPIAKQEMDPFAKATYFPFGPMVLFSLESPGPYKKIESALSIYRWRDRCVLWDISGQPNTLYKMWQDHRIIRELFTKEWFAFLPLGAANLSNVSNQPFSVFLQFKYLAQVFFKPSGKYKSFYFQSNDETQFFVRRRVASYMMGMHLKGGFHFDRKSYGTALHWKSNCFNKLEFIDLSEIPETIPHLVYLCIAAQNENDRGFFIDKLQTKFNWFPRDALDLLKSVQRDISMEVNDKIMECFHLNQVAENYRQQVESSRYLAIKALIERKILPKDSALSLIRNLSRGGAKEPHILISCAEALAECGPLSLDVLQDMAVSQNHPPQIRVNILPFIAMVKDDKSLIMLADIVCPPAELEQSQVMIEGALSAMSRIHDPKRWTELGNNAVITAVNRIWSKLKINSSKRDKNYHYCLQLIMQLFQLLQYDIPDDMLAESLISDNSLTQLCAIQLRLETIARHDSVVLTEEETSKFRQIMLTTVQRSGKHNDQMLSLLKCLATHRDLAEALFNAEFCLQMLLGDLSPYIRPSVLKIIKKTHPDPVNFFGQTGSSGNLLSPLLELSQPAGVRLGVIGIIKEWPDLMQLDHVYKQILLHADPEKNQEISTAAKALELLAQYRFNNNHVQEYIIKWCLLLGKDPSLRAIKLIEHNIFSFDLPVDLGHRFIKAIESCYGNSNTCFSSESDENCVYASNTTDESIITLCRFYSLVMRTGAVPAMWTDINIILPKIVDLLNQSSQYYTIKNGRRALHGMLSVYRLKLGTDIKSISNRSVWDNFIGPLRKISELCAAQQSEKSVVRRSNLLVAFLGLNLYREPPHSLHLVFRKLSRGINDLISDNLTSYLREELQEKIAQARETVNKIANELLPGSEERECSCPVINDVLFPETALGTLLQKYLDQPDRDVFHQIQEQIEILFPAGDEESWASSFWEHSSAYLAKWQRVQETLWVGPTSFLLHNLHRLSKQEDDSAEKTLSIAKWLLRLPALVNSLMLNVPEMISLSEFLYKHKKGLENKFSCPGSLSFKQVEPGLQVYFDEKRLLSVLENCFSNAVQSVASINNYANSQNIIKLDVQISCSNNEQGVEIVIEDNGNGLPPGFMDEIKQDKPQGLGTYIIRAYVESAGGEVVWENIVPDDNSRGARVRFILPCKEVFDNA